MLMFFLGFCKILIVFSKYLQYFSGYTLVVVRVEYLHKFFVCLLNKSRSFVMFSGVLRSDWPKEKLGYSFKNNLSAVMF